MSFYIKDIKSFEKSLEEFYNITKSDRGADIIQNNDDKIDFMKQIKSNLKYNILNLEKMRLTIRGLIGIPKILRFLPKITKINFYDNLIQDSGVHSVFNMFRTHLQIKSLDIGCNDLSDGSILTLCDLLKKTNINRLQLGRKEVTWQANKFSLDFLSNLLNVIIEKNNIECLGLSGIIGIKSKKMIQKSPLSYFINQLVQNSNTISTLDISHLGFVETDQDLLGKGFSINKSLRYLNLKGNSFPNSINLVNGIKLIKTLKYLDLSSCLLNKNSCIILSDALSKDWELISLNLSENPIGSEGIGYLLRSLSKNIYLNSLNISHTCFDSNISNDLTYFLENNLSLQKINFSKNFFGDSLIFIFSQFLDSNDIITDLSFNSCRITDEGGISLVHSLIYNKSLYHIDLSDNFLTTSFGFQLVDLLRPNEIIKKIKINSNKLDLFSMEAVENLCKRNKFAKEEVEYLPLRQEYIQLSIKKSQIPRFMDKLKKIENKKEELNSKSITLEVDYDSFNTNSKINLLETERLIKEYERMILDEQKFIDDFSLKQEELINESNQRILDINKNTEKELEEMKNLEISSEKIETETEKIHHNTKIEKEKLLKEIENLQKLLKEINEIENDPIKLSNYNPPHFSIDTDFSTISTLTLLKIPEFNLSSSRSNKKSTRRSQQSSSRLKS